jgi:dTDP-4-amino-4,6-dideoxygalactose transaminase
MAGGTPVRTAPFAPWPHFAADEVAAAADVLRSGKVSYWTGNEGRQFEQEFAAYAGTDHAVALVNGTVALELALHALGIGPGNDVLVTSRTFVASASAVVMRGARPVMVDVDRHSQNITAETLRAAMTPDTAAIIAVHLAGWPCEMDPVMGFAQDHGLKVIEDCAQALGATYRGRPVGSLGHAGAFSFCQDKILTTGGEGGMLTTADPALWERAWSFKDHGKSYDAVYRRPHPPGYGFKWLHESFGTNGRMTEMQAAIGRVQLRKLPEWISARRRNARILTDCFRGIPGLRVAEPPAEVEHAYYKYYAFVRPERLRTGWDRDRILDAVNAEGVPCQAGSCSEVYLEKAFDRPGLRPDRRLPVARELGETSLMFLVHPTLDASAMQDTCRAVEKVFAAASLP